MGWTTNKSVKSVDESAWYSADLRPRWDCCRPAPASQPFLPAQVRRVASVRPPCPFQVRRVASVRPPFQTQPPQQRRVASGRSPFPTACACKVSFKSPPGWGPPLGGAAFRPLFFWLKFKAGVRPSPRFRTRVQSCQDHPASPHAGWSDRSMDLEQARDVLLHGASGPRLSQA